MTNLPEGAPSRLTAGDLAQPIMAGVLAALVGYASTFTLVLAGLAHMGASPAEAASGLMAMCLALGVLNGVVVWRLRIPLSFAWSTPGAAFLLTLAPVDGGFAAATGAFVVVGVMVALTGLIRPITRAVARIPPAIASAMLAGVLLGLCLAPVRAVAELPALALPVIAAWVVGLRFARRYAVPLAVAAAVTGLVLAGGGSGTGLAVDLPLPVLAWPVFTIDAVVRIALPLYVITMASQNLTGIAVMRANGFEIDPRGPLIETGLASAAIAPFGGLTVNLAAITAALAAGPEAHPDPSRRWVAPVAAAATYTLLAFGATLAAAFIAASPPVLIQAVAGLALLPSLAAALAASMADEEARLPAIVTFATTASGVTILGIGGAFWGLLAGLALIVTLRRRPAK